MKKILCVIWFGIASMAQDTATLDSRISVSTLLREDIFAGFMANDIQRFERGERNIAKLLQERQTQRPELMAWKASTFVTRAVWAHEQNKEEEFTNHFRNALVTFNEAQAMGGDKPNIGVMAIMGGTYAVFADRLPEVYRKAAWLSAYRAYQSLWKVQAESVEKLPLHIKGELLSGLALTAQRTGKTAELAEHLDRITTLLAGSPYEIAARKWKENPQSASNVRIACMTCHEGGRLEAVRARTAKKVVN